MLLNSGNIFFSVWPHTEAKIYNDQFFEDQDIVVNALDNVEARRYVDRWAIFVHVPYYSATYLIRTAECLPWTVLIRQVSWLDKCPD